MEKIKQIPQKEIEQIIHSWKFMNQNSIKSLAVCYGYSVHKINKIIDNHLKSKTNETREEKDV
jgi:hypothetical protein